ncbi:hypothetical protein Leryth_006322 [Lithospermum erythrorhizon]|nr:hypothetical protein Leryth_006322 [Lithospermum erythrorhizon]
MKVEESRLRRKAPKSLKINREELDWNVAIPLLSPLVASPDRIDFNSSTTNNNKQKKEVEKPRVTVVVGKRWQHPAAPFCYEPAPLVPFGLER